MRPCRRGAGRRRSVWYSRMVRTGRRACRASSSTVSSTASAAWVSDITMDTTVTVNTVTMIDDLPGRLLAVLRTATGSPPLDFAAPPEPLTRGFWAELLAFRLAGPPAAFDRHLCARGMPDPPIARTATPPPAAAA